MAWLYIVSLRVTHPYQELSVVVKKMGMRPIRIWKGGDPKSTPAGKLLEGKYAGTFANSYCCFGIKSDTDDGELPEDYVSAAKCVPDVVQLYVEKMKPHVALWQEITTTGGELNFYIAWDIDAKSFTEEFKWILLKDLAEFQICLSFDIIKFVPRDPEWNYDEDGDRKSEPYNTYTVELRIRHPHRNLSIVPETMGLEPVRLWKASESKPGDSVSQDQRLAERYIDSYCALRVAPTEEHVSDVITAFVKKMQPHAALWQEITATGGELEFFIGWDVDVKTFAEEFKWELLQDLVEFRISLALDLNKRVPLISDSTNVG